jgi:hypothetical protein
MKKAHHIYRFDVLRGDPCDGLHDVRTLLHDDHSRRLRGRIPHCDHRSETFGHLVDTTVA